MCTTRYSLIRRYNEIPGIAVFQQPYLGRVKVTVLLISPTQPWSGTAVIISFCGYTLAWNMGWPHINPRLCRSALLLSDPYYEDAWWAKLGYISGRMKTTQHIYHTRCKECDGRRGVLYRQE